MSVAVQMCVGKIHRATVTDANLDYVGSVEIDQELMVAASILPSQLVHINNLRNGAHWETYAVPAPKGSGTVCLNGPPAHHFQKGDLVIILSLWSLSNDDLEEVANTGPTVVFVDESNHITLKT